MGKTGFRIDTDTEIFDREEIEILTRYGRQFKRLTTANGRSLIRCWWGMLLSTVTRKSTEPAMASRSGPSSRSAQPIS